LVTQEFEQRTRELIDSLKAICAAYGLGNDGNEFKIITQVFLYKFLNDKFAFEAKKIRPGLANAESWEAAIAAMSADDRDMLQMQMGHMHLIFLYLVYKLTTRSQLAACFLRLHER